MPPDHVFTSRPAASARSNASISSRARSRASRRPSRNRRPIISRFSEPVCSPSTAADWPVRLIWRRTASGAVRTSYPATIAVPRSGASSVDRILTSVVLPAPFGPSSAWTVPGGTSRSTAFSTGRPPRSLPRPIVVIPLDGSRFMSSLLRIAYTLECMVYTVT